MEAETSVLAGALPTRSQTHNRRPRWARVVESHAHSPVFQQFNQGWITVIDNVLWTSKLRSFQKCFVTPHELQPNSSIKFARLKLRYMCTGGRPSRNQPYLKNLFAITIEGVHLLKFCSVWNQYHNSYKRHGVHRIYYDCHQFRQLNVKMNAKFKLKKVVSVSVNFIGMADIIWQWGKS